MLLVATTPAPYNKFLRSYKLDFLEVAGIGGLLMLRRAALCMSLDGCVQRRPLCKAHGAFIALDSGKGKNVFGQFIFHLLAVSFRMF